MPWRFAMLTALALLAFAASNVLTLSVGPMLPGWDAPRASVSYWYSVIDSAANTLFAFVVPWLALWPLAVQVQRALGSPPVTSRVFITTHASVCLGFSVVEQFVHVAFEPDTGFFHFDPLYRAVMGVSNYFGFNLLIYAGIAAVHQALDNRRQLRQRALNEARLEASLARAHLDSLRAKIQPHFVFNTLQSINTLVLDHQVERASDMIEELSVLLRRAFEGDERQIVTVREEVDSVRGYLAIQAIRFGDRLRVAWAVARDAERALVPSLVLQPLIENAIKHGVAVESEMGTVTVGARRLDDRVILSVRNDGPSLAPGWRLDEQAGFGVKATRRRLELLYGSAGSFELRDWPGGGVEARISIPFREEVFAVGAPARV